MTTDKVRVLLLLENGSKARENWLILPSFPFAIFETPPCPPSTLFHYRAEGIVPHWSARHAPAGRRGILHRRPINAVGITCRVPVLDSLYRGCHRRLRTPPASSQTGCAKWR